MKRIVLAAIILTIFCKVSSFAQPVNDDCSGAINIGTLPAPSACPNGLGNIITTNGTLVGATASDPYISQPNCTGGTQSSLANDVWYIYTASGPTGVISLTSTFATPNIAVYSGSCLLMGGGVGGCAVGAGGTVSITINQMSAGQTYLIQISGAVGETGTFTFDIQNNFNCSNCLIESSLLVNPLPVNGMYQPGDVVNFCFTISDYVQANTNWLHGVQISYGAGWQGISNQVFPAPVAGTGTWDWYNSVTSQASGNTFGQGFYIDLDGDGDPGNNFGDDCVQDGSGGNDLPCIGGLSWTFCFTMTVAPICNPGSDLSVTINTSGDGESGSWQDLGCAGDPPYIFNAVGSCCPPAMVSTPEGCGNADGTATASPVGNFGPYVYHWTGPGGYDQTNSNINGANTITGLVAGTYTLAITDINNCQVFTTVQVGTGQLPTADAGISQTICNGDSILLDGTYAGSANSGTWSGGAGIFIPNITTLNAVYVPSLAEYAAGSVTLTLTVSDASGFCTGTATVTHNFYPDPIVQFSVDDPNGCPEHCVVFSDQSIAGGGTVVRWDWDFGDGTTGSAQNPAHCYSQTGFYDVALNIVTSNGCEDQLTIANMIEVFAQPVAEFTPNPTTVPVLDAQIIFNDQSSSDVVSWFWDFGNGWSLSPDIQNPSYLYPPDSSGYFLVTLIVQNADGCYDTVAHEIFVAPMFTFYIPNAFTPHNDQTNEYFFAKGMGIADFDMRIFDRWGNEVFHGIDINDKWNGKVFNNTELAQRDVYVWRVDLTDVIGEKHSYIGHVTLVR